MTPDPTPAPAQAKIEERHLQLAGKFYGNLKPFTGLYEELMQQVAQLIANSEADATAELRADVERLERNCNALNAKVVAGIEVLAKLTAAEAQVQRLRDACRPLATELQAFVEQLLIVQSICRSRDDEYRTAFSKLGNVMHRIQWLLENSDALAASAPPPAQEQKPEGGT